MASINVVEEIRKFVEEECKKPGSKYGFEPYETHFIPVVENARNLAEKLGADKEVVLIAAWMHDIGSIIYGRKNHHVTGAEIAEKQLKKLEYPEEKIALVKKCILNHRGSVRSARATVEEQIIADADGMSAFDRIEGLFRAALVNEGLGQIDSREAVRQKLINSFEKLSPLSQELIRNKYVAAMLLLK